MMVHGAIGEVGIKVPPPHSGGAEADAEIKERRGDDLFLSEAPIEIAEHAHNTGGFDFHRCSTAVLGESQITRVRQGVQLW